MLNQARLKVLKARDDHVNQVLEKAKKQLATISQDKSRYPQLLEGLIAQVSIEILILVFLLGLRYSYEFVFDKSNLSNIVLSML